MAKWNEQDQMLMLDQDDVVLIKAEGVGDFIQIRSVRHSDDQTLEIFEYLNDELIYSNIIPGN